MEKAGLIFRFHLLYPAHAFFIFTYTSMSDDITGHTVMTISRVKQKVKRLMTSGCGEAVPGDQLKHP